MREFYELTGVRPYLYILPNGESTSTQELGEYADRLYGELFGDEAHFLLVFCDSGNGTFNCGYAAGSQAKSVMDDAAVAVLADELDRYYSDYSINESELFSRAFSATAQRIMDDGEGSAASALPVAGIALAALVASLAFILVLRRRERERAERERTERILSQPLQTYGDARLEELARKYEGGAAAASGTSAAPVASAAPAASAAAAASVPGAQGVQGAAPKADSASGAEKD